MGESLEIAIRVRNRKGEKGKQETEDEKNKREGPFKPGSVKKQRLRCFKQRNQSKCPRIFLFGNDEVGVASQVKFISGILIIWFCSRCMIDWKISAHILSQSEVRAKQFARGTSSTFL